MLLLATRKRLFLKTHLIFRSLIFTCLSWAATGLQAITYSHAAHGSSFGPSGLTSLFWLRFKREREKKEEKSSVFLAKRLPIPHLVDHEARQLRRGLNSSSTNGSHLTDCLFKVFFPSLKPRATSASIAFHASNLSGGWYIMVYFFSVKLPRTACMCN
jgi:hypothetical protein